MSPEEIIAFWGPDRLRSYASAAVQQAVIPQSSKDFLLSVGFPTGDLGWTMEFDDEAFGLPRLPGRSWYRRFGRDYEVPICFDERRGGCVIGAETRRVAPERLFNSSIEQFGAFLVLYQRFRQTPSELSDRESLGVRRACEREMRGIDLAAFSDPENAWPLVLDDLYGMLGVIRSRRTSASKRTGTRKPR